MEIIIEIDGGVLTDFRIETSDGEIIRLPYTLLDHDNEREEVE